MSPSAPSPRRDRTDRTPHGSSPAVTDIDELIDRAAALMAGPRRSLLGIVGAPGAGKSTLAELLVERLGPGACQIGMDGFHLSGQMLRRLGRLHRKGAIDTFDGHGFHALVRRVRAERSHTVYAPAFDREIEEPIAGAVAVQPADTLVIVEGNYLLADTPPWSELQPLLDETWYLAPDEEVRIANLIARHRTGGKSAQEARAWALGSDQVNAKLIAGSQVRADLVATLGRPELERGLRGGRLPRRT